MIFLRSLLLRFTGAMPEDPVYWNLTDLRVSNHNEFVLLLTVRTFVRELPVLDLAQIALPEINVAPTARAGTACRSHVRHVIAFFLNNSRFYCPHDAAS